MLLSTKLFAASWHYRRYSYAAVLVATALGLAFPQQAGLVLALPLAVGLVVLGVAHGACDQLVVPADQSANQAASSGWRYWLRFLLAYLGLAAVVGGLWWRWPALTVGLFFLLTIWHWGSADAPTMAAAVPTRWWLTHSLLRGLLLFAVPAWWWSAQTAGIVDGLLTFTGAPGLDPAGFGRAATGLGWAVGIGHLVLWGMYARRHRWALLRTELVEVLVLVGLLMALPPKLSVGVYFVFWHSLQHVLRLNNWLGYARTTAADPTPARSLTWSGLLAQMGFFLRRAAPLLVLSCAALLVLGWLLASRLPNEAAWFSLALLVASIVTLPHALLVTLVMDARHWHRSR